MESTNVKPKRLDFFTESDPITDRCFKEIRSIPFLEHDEQIALIKKFKETGCLESRDKLIASNQRFVVSVAKKFANNSNLLDLIDKVNIGLITAIEKYDVNSGFKFITYAVWYIHSEINTFLMGRNDSKN